MPQLGYRRISFLCRERGAEHGLGPPAWQTRPWDSAAGGRAVPDISMLPSVATPGQTLIFVTRLWQTCPQGTACDFLNPNDVFANYAGTSFVRSRFRRNHGPDYQKSGDRRGKRTMSCTPWPGTVRELCSFNRSQPGKRAPTWAPSAQWSAYFHDVSGYTQPGGSPSAPF